MDIESQRIYDRMTLHRLMENHPNWSPAHLAAQVGRSERWGRKWVKRLKSVKKQSYEMYRSESRAPKTNPRKTQEPVKDVICELRETLSEEYHRPAGPRLIKHYVRRDKTLKEAGYFIPVSSATITKILRERGYIVDPPKHIRIPLALCDPMEEWEMDFCEIRLVDGRFEFFLVVDRGTSRVIHIEGCEGYRADTALMAIYRLFLFNGLPKRLRFDRDPRFVWSWTADSFPAPLIRFLHALEVEPVICPPRRPDKKPHVERCVGTFKHEWLDRFSLNTMADCYEASESFPHYHNTERVHLGRACDGRTPDEAYPNLPKLPRLPDNVQPNKWLTVQHGRVFRRRIRSTGVVQIDKHTYYVNHKLAKRPVLIHLDGHNRCFRVTLEGKPLPNVLPIKGLHDEELALLDYLKHLQEEALSIAHYRHMMWMQSGDVA